jgi:hypothetical protein
MRGDRLAIAAVAGLAGAAALRRAGSRSVELRVDVFVTTADLPFSKLSASAPVVEVSWPGGSSRVTAERLRMVYERSGPPRSGLQDMQALLEFAEWARSLQFPLTVYRGLLTGEEEAHRPGAGFRGTLESWSADERSALRFTRPGSPTARRQLRVEGARTKGLLVTAVIERPGDVAWLDTLGFFLTYSAGQVEPEHEIVPGGAHVEPQVVRVQEVERAAQASRGREAGPAAASAPEVRRSTFEEL